jgi:hypothetical protein
MLIQSIYARRAVGRRLSSIGYSPGPDIWRELRLGIARDIQARSLPPNIKVPPRRQALSYIRTVHRATGSLSHALVAMLHAGSWTSSGGSFRLAESLGVDIPALAAMGLSHGGFSFLEIGAGWAGLHPSQQAVEANDIAGLAQQFPSALGTRLRLHFTNLTRWHATLPPGVIEHPFTTAAGLLAVEPDGVNLSSVDMIYSQAAAYFEPDVETFMASAAALLRPGGVLLFNHKTEFSERVGGAAHRLGLQPSASQELGGMNGRVALFTKGQQALLPPPGQRAADAAGSQAMIVGAV